MADKGLEEGEDLYLGILTSRRDNDGFMFFTQSKLLKVPRLLEVLSPLFPVVA